MTLTVNKLQTSLEKVKFYLTYLRDFTRSSYIYRELNIPERYFGQRANDNNNIFIYFWPFKDYIKLGTLHHDCISFTCVKDTIQ